MLAMRDDDTRRLERERSIHAATRGPDYSVYLSDLSKRRQETQKRSAARVEYIAQQRHGHAMAVARGERSGRFIEPGS